MGLSKKEQAMLEALTKKAEEPDRAPADIRYNIDLSDDKAFSRAVKMGLLSDPDAEGDADDEDEEDEPDDAPRRRGSSADRFFGK